jgi:Na+-translocating ferredoxin:NAD+ oxidoreductase RnfC subunit
MSEGEIILRVDATYPLEVTDGDVVRGGEKIQMVPDTDEPIVAPVSGTIKSIHFDPANHEFIVVIVPAR